LFGPEMLAKTMESLATHLKSDGIWYFSDFNVSKSFPMNWISKALIRLMYVFFRLGCDINASSLPDFEAAFGQKSLQSIDFASFYGGMIISRLYKRQ
jgi:hypothetical protein